jgi:hypothetical protein
MDEDMFVDDLYDMEDDQLRAEADRYARLARHGPDHPKVEYRFAYPQTSRSIRTIESEE